MLLLLDLLDFFAAVFLATDFFAAFLGFTAAAFAGLAVRFLLILFFTLETAGAADEAAAVAAGDLVREGDLLMLLPFVAVDFAPFLAATAFLGALREGFALGRAAIFLLLLLTNGLCVSCLLLLRLQQHKERKRQEERGTAMSNRNLFLFLVG